MRSIRRSLLFMLLGGAAVLLALACGLFFWRARLILTSEFDQASRSKALALVTLTEKRQSHVKLNFADEFMPEYERRDRPEYFQLWLANGQILERSRSLKGGNLPRRTGGVAAPLFWDMTLLDGRPGRAVGIEFVPQPYTEGDDDLLHREAKAGAEGRVTLVQARERAELNHTLAALSLALGSGSFAFLAAAAAFVAWAVRRGLAPLETLATRAESMAAESLSERFPIEGLPVELRPISERLNDLLARLEDAFQRERRVSADIAHELRTPLAEIRSRVEVAMRWPEDAEAALGHVWEIGRKMEAMVTSLLALARSEAGKLESAPEDIPVATMVDDLWRPLADKAGAKRLNFLVTISPDLRVRSDASLLRVIMANLLDNAVAYTPEIGSIQVTTDDQHGRISLSVENTVHDLAPEDVPRLFERFWRKDASRASVGHAGLGLTLARAIANRLGLEINAEMPATNRLRISLNGLSSDNGPTP